MSAPVIAVLRGGTSSEREVSLGSGRACALALARSFPTCEIDVTADAVPAGLDAARHVVFSALHGGFGENGGMQAALEAAGIQYAGCGVAASALTIDKTRTKAAVAAAGVRVPPGLTFAARDKPPAAAIAAQLAGPLVLKPNDQGSSVGLYLTTNTTELEVALHGVTAGDWLVEARIAGRELSVGVLHGRAMGVVEIRPRSGVYDYTSKYTKGLTEYLAPAPLGDSLTRTVQQAAETAFAACGCRDYGRVDFMLSAENIPFFLAINPLPGMKETSLLPMSARCAGLDFTALVREMVGPALQRFQSAAAMLHP
ncbi:MAG: D-alanine--D-alanine ligase [Pseudomonadota bacterium]